MSADSRLRQAEQPIQTGARSSGIGPLHGKFRGVVVDNIDPLGLGRILAQVPQVPKTLGFALPCVPYAGPGVGFFAIPPIGALVWIEFEGGDPSLPIWVGCYWGDQTQVPAGGDPMVKIFRTQYCTLRLDDTPADGGVTLAAASEPADASDVAEGVPAVETPSQLRMSTTGTALTVIDTVIEATPESITAQVPEAKLLITAEAITVTVPPAIVTLTAVGLSAP